MATFSKPESFFKPAEYAKLLRTALNKVTEKGTPFHYYKAYEFEDKKVRPLLLVDHDKAIVAALKLKKLEPSAKGDVTLMPTDELKFAADNPASLPVRKLAEYLTKLAVPRQVYLGDANDGDDDAGPDNEADDAAAVPMQTPQPKPAPVQAAATLKALPTPPVKTVAATKALPTPPAKTMAATKPLPTPAPADLVALARELSTTPLQPEFEAKKAAALKMANDLLGRGDHASARTVLQGLSGKRLAVKSEDDASDELDTHVPVLVLNSQAMRDATRAPTSAVASAQQRLAQEEEAFMRHKTLRKSEKIKASDSQQALTQQEVDAKAARKMLEAMQSGGSKNLRDYLPFGKDKDKAAKATGDRIDQSQANKKLADEMKKNYNRPTDATGALAQTETNLSKGIGQTLDKTDHGDDIASAAGTVAAGAAAAASSIADVVREVRLYRKSTGADRSVHLHKAIEALGSAAASLVNVSKGSVAIAGHAGAAEAGSAVPILGIVAAVPTLISEINELRSAIVRLTKQQKIHGQLEHAVEGGDTSQATLFTLVSGFISRDSETIGKSLTKVVLDFTRIAGHGVAAGGITGPAGVALVGIGTAGKLMLSGVGGVQDLAAAHQANDRRKKLQPTLHAMRDWKELPKDRPNDMATKNLTQTIQALETVEKGTPAHAKALESLGVAAKAFAAVNPNSPKAKEFAAQLQERAAEEAASWKDADDGTADPLAQKKGNTLSPQEAQHRDARKLMGKDPRVAAQTLLDQAQREPAPNGGPAMAVLASFGIKAKQVYGPEQGDDRIASNREMRQKILFKLGAEDETAQTLTQSMGEAKDSVKAYFSPSKNDELADYKKAKNLLQHGGSEKRSKLWQFKMNLVTADVEENKAALLGQMELLVAAKDIDLNLADEVRKLLAPRKEKAAA